MHGFYHSTYELVQVLENKQKNRKNAVLIFGSPNQIRTGVLALKGRCPGPLDDGAKTAI